MASGQDIVNDCRSLIIEPNPAFFSDTRMLSLVNLGQADLVRRSRVLEAQAYASTVTNQAVYAIPGDFLGSLKVWYNNQQGGVDAWIPLQPKSIEKMSQEFPNFPSTSIVGTQIPTRYFFVGNQIQLYPTPTVGNVSNNLLMIYERKPTTLNALSDPLSVDVSLDPGITAWVLWRLYAQDNEDVKSAAWKAEYEAEVGRARAWKKMRQLDSKTSLDVESWNGRSYSSWGNGVGQAQINPLGS
jgi:hypothetical protein